VLSLPNDPALTGITLFAQGLALDAQGPALGLAFTAGLGLRIGE